MSEIADFGCISMKKVDRFLIGALTLGVWTLLVIQVTSIDMTHAQETQIAAEDNEKTQEHVLVIHANDVVGLSALIEKSASGRQLRPQSIPGLDQYIKSIVRGCRVNGSVRGDQITSANISC